MSGYNTRTTELDESGAYGAPHCNSEIFRPHSTAVSGIRPQQTDDDSVTTRGIAELKKIVTSAACANS
jgi:hypothetical protein